MGESRGHTQLAWPTPGPDLSKSKHGLSVLAGVEPELPAVRILGPRAAPETTILRRLNAVGPKADPRAAQGPCTTAKRSRAVRQFPRSPATDLRRLGGNLPIPDICLQQATATLARAQRPLQSKPGLWALPGPRYPEENLLLRGTSIRRVDYSCFAACSGATQLRLCCRASVARSTAAVHTGRRQVRHQVVLPGNIGNHGRHERRKAAPARSRFSACFRCFLPHRLRPAGGSQRSRNQQRQNPSHTCPTNGRHSFPAHDSSSVPPFGWPAGDELRGRGLWELGRTLSRQLRA